MPGVHIGADPMGGASVQYWGYIAENLGIDLTVVNPKVDPRWSFMTLDTDGKIRMDCSSPNAMASLIRNKDEYDIATGNDADADRHGIVTPDAGLMNPERTTWPSPFSTSTRTARAGDPMRGSARRWCRSSMIDRVAASLGRTLVEVPVGFKWFVPGLRDRRNRLRRRGVAQALRSCARTGAPGRPTRTASCSPCSPARSQAVTGKSPSELYAELTAEHGGPAYARIDAPANREQKAKLGQARRIVGHGHRARRRADHRDLDQRARQRRPDRRREGRDRVCLVRRAAVGHRGRLQDLRRVVQGP